MLTEFEVRRQVEDIQVSDASPNQKVRRLLRIGRLLKLQSRSHARVLSPKVTNPNSAACLKRLASSFRSLYEDVRLAARGLPGETPGSFGGA